MALSDVADVKFVDSPSSVARENKEYTVTISAEYTEKATQNTRNQIQEASSKASSDQHSKYWLKFQGSVQERGVCIPV